MRWIKIRNMRPEHEEKVLFYSKEIGVKCGMYVNMLTPEQLKSNDYNPHDCFIGFGGAYVDKITHWMPFPNAPKGE